MTAVPPRHQPILSPPAALHRGDHENLHALRHFSTRPLAWLLPWLLAIVLPGLSGCEQWLQPESPQLVLKAARFTDLPGWAEADLSGFATAFRRSCERIAGKPAERPFAALKEAGNYRDWQQACRDFAALGGAGSVTTASLRRYLETAFQPWQVSAGKDEKGLFTGYYEASLNGSLSRHPPYTTPLHKRPADLVMVNLGEFRDDLKGVRIAGRVKDGMLRPYESRDQIVAGKWPHRDHALVWVDDPIAAFFVQIQGSGVVTLDDGRQMRIGYDGQNGHPYTAIGRELIRRGALTADTVSMQTIRQWLRDHPREAGEVMNHNASYVFFRIVDREGAVGGEGVVLTPGTSLAVDSTLLGYGLPLWVDIAPPVDGESPLRRLMVAQDTGGAIRGPVRGDVFWGFGERAEYLAGHMKSTGSYWVLLPLSGTNSNQSGSI